MKAGIRIRKAEDTDRPQVCGLIAACGLPTAGAQEHLARGYALAERGQRLVGVAGIEIHGEYGLLRSLAVAPEWRGGSIGRDLVRDRLAWARAAGLRNIFLLTTKAAGYFERLGFKRVDRDAVPHEIKASHEFASLCPKTAIVMMSEIGDHRK